MVTKWVLYNSTMDSILRVGDESLWTYLKFGPEAKEQQKA